MNFSSEQENKIDKVVKVLQKYQLEAYTDNENEIKEVRRHVACNIIKAVEKIKSIENGLEDTRGMLLLYKMIRQKERISFYDFEVKNKPFLAKIEKLIENELQLKQKDADGLLNDVDTILKLNYKTKRRLKINIARAVYFETTMRIYPEGKNIKTKDAAMVWDILIILDVFEKDWLAYKKAWGANDNDKKNYLKSWFDTTETNGKKEWKNSQ